MVRVPEANDWIGPVWLPPHYSDLSEVQLRDATTTQRIASLHPDGVRLMALMVSDGILYYEQDGHHPLDGRLLCKKFGDNSSAHFQGPKNKEHCVKLWRANGNPVWFAGARHQEYEVREIQPDGEIQEYEGKKHEEHIVSSTWPGELTQHYRGARGAEHLVKVEWPDGNSMLFVGPKGRERKVREMLANGCFVDYYGYKGKECMLRKVSPNGIETLYQVAGPYLGAICRIKHPDGSYIDYDGPKDKEWMIARMDTDSERRLTLYDGKRGREYKTKTCYLRSDVVARRGEDRGEVRLEVRNPLRSLIHKPVRVAVEEGDMLSLLLIEHHHALGGAQGLGLVIHKVQEIALKSTKGSTDLEPHRPLEHRLGLGVPLHSLPVNADAAEEARAQMQSISIDLRPRNVPL